MRVSYRVDHAIRVMTALAVANGQRPGEPVAATVLADAEGVAPGFLDDTLRGLRNRGLLRSRRGAQGGWLLARPASAITVADVIRALEGPLASVRGIRPDELPAAGDREPFVSLWIAVRASLRSVLEVVTIADLADGNLPRPVAELAANPENWASHSTVS